MKILFIIDSVGRGGKERRMLELIRHLTYIGKHKVILITLTNLIEYEIVYSLPIDFLVIKQNIKNVPLMYFRLLRLIKKHSPQIIHSWSSLSNLYSLPIAKLLNIKFITSVIADGTQSLTIRNKYFFRFKLIAPFVDKIISNSNAGLKGYKSPKKKSICIYNGYDFNRSSFLEEKSLIKKRLNIENAVIIGMVAAFEERKDYATLIDAAKIVIHAKPGSIFLLIGDGVLKEGIVQSIAEELRNNILFLGRINDVESYINIFDVGILCTNNRLGQEGISNSIMEYMALGKPVIATEGGGTNEIVIDGVTGFLVPPYNSKVLANKIIYLINNPELRNSFGSQSRERVNELFTMERMFAQFNLIYDQTVKI